MPQFGDGSQYPMKAATPATLLRRAVIDIGATGAPTVNTDPGIGVTRNTTGLYDVTFNPIADYTKTLPVLEVGVLKSAATTVAGAVIVAFSPTNGTAQFRTFLATPGTGVDPANGDQLWLELKAGISPAR